MGYRGALRAGETIPVVACFALDALRVECRGARDRAQAMRYRGALRAGETVPVVTGFALDAL